VRDLFYNSKQRKRSLGANEEYQKVVDVVAKYSVHYPLIKFTCKKVEDKRTDVSTHAVPRPDELMQPSESQEDLTQEQVISLMNQVRVDILKRHFGQG
jgi:DNA mismatch repair ATPase MutL